LVLKYTKEEVRRVTAAPKSGIYRLLKDGSVVFDRHDTSRANIDDETEGFFMRITGVDDFVYEGADLGILTCEGRMMNKKFQLNARAKKWIDGLNGFFQTRPLDPFENAPESALLPGAFKML
ncbi:biotin carboxylase, partial [Pseudomonadota bacterium]